MVTSYLHFNGRVMVELMFNFCTFVITSAADNFEAFHCSTPPSLNLNSSVKSPIYTPTANGLLYIMKCVIYVEPDRYVFLGADADTDIRE